LLIPVERVSEVVPKEKRVLLRPDSLPSNSDADGE
jgi:hypothetical protein